jgi:hypothetical protein
LLYRLRENDSPEEREEEKKKRETEDQSCYHFWALKNISPQLVSILPQVARCAFTLQFSETP